MKSLSQDVFDALAGGDATARRPAFDTFQQLSLPTPKEEAWKYVEVDFDLDDHTLVADPGDPLPDDPFVAGVSGSGRRVTIVDGRTVRIDVDSGLVVSPNAEFDLVAPGLDKFAAANAAFGVDGVTIAVPKGFGGTDPLVVDVQQVTPSSIGFPSIAIRAEEASEASIVVLYRSPVGARAALAPNISVKAEAGAQLRLTTAQLMGSDGLVVGHQRVEAGRDATVRLGEVGLGGRYARLDLGIRLVGDGSSAELVGLSFGEHSQVLDYRVVVDHVGRDTSSNVFIKGAVEDEAQSVFTGLLRIEKDAVRTSAFETNRNLVLSPGAKANSVPNLEILCDDVVCGHGSSVGPLEDDHLYYLQSRGISKSRAERVLIRGFFAEVIDRLPTPGLSGPLRDAVNRRFVQAQEEGRLG